MIDTSVSFVWWREIKLIRNRRIREEYEFKVEQIYFCDWWMVSFSEQHKFHHHISYPFSSSCYQIKVSALHTVGVVDWRKLWCLFARIHTSWIHQIQNLKYNHCMLNRWLSLMPSLLIQIKWDELVIIQYEIISMAQAYWKEI